MTKTGFLAALSEILQTDAPLSEDMESCNHLAPCSVLLDTSHTGSHNHLAPGTIIYKECGDTCRMFGNPALKIGTLL